MLQRSRILVVATLLGILILFLALEIRLFVIQIVDPDQFAEKARCYHYKQEEIAAPRGSILDSRGAVLANSIPAVEVWANTRELDKPWTEADDKFESAELLAPLLDREYEKLCDRMSLTGYRALNRNVTDPADILSLYTLKEQGKLRGIDLQKKFVRRYPRTDFLGHSLGFVNHEGQGVFGVEAVGDAFLTGKPGTKMHRRDGVQNIIYTSFKNTRKGLPGGDIYLTIDSSIQLMAEMELTRIDIKHNPKWAAVVVLEPASGRILAAASHPSLNPCAPEEGPEDHWTNRVFASQYIPGSSFKPLFMAMAMDRGLVHEDEQIDCEGGTWRIRGRRITDTHVNYRILDPAGILIKSSNIGMSKIALRLVPEGTPKGSALFRPYRDLLGLLGLGKRPGVLSCAQEGAGMISPLSQWTANFTLVSLSFGNEIAVTPIQMASALGALANDGVYVPPRLIDKMVTPGGKEISLPSAAGCRVFTCGTTRIVKDMMVRVVEEGSGRKVRIPGVAVAGKTGTAEKLPEKIEVTSSFVAFAPAERPAVLVLTVIDEPKGEHFASQVVAPHVKTILERVLAFKGLLPGANAPVATIGGER